MKKIFSVLLCITMLMCSSTGCGVDDNLSVDSTLEQSQSVEYETIKPPEDGWTREEFMSTVYLCGKQLTYPLTMEYLGEDFSLDEANKADLNDSIGYPLLYKNNEIGRVFFKKNSGESSGYGNITTMMFNDTFSKSDPDCIVVNGISLGSSNTDVKSALGTPGTGSTYGEYEYTVKNGDDRFIDIVLNKEKEVAVINIYLKRE